MNSSHASPRSYNIHFDCYPISNILLTNVVLNLINKTLENNIYKIYRKLVIYFPQT